MARLTYLGLEPAYWDHCSELDINELNDLEYATELNVHERVEADRVECLPFMPPGSTLAGLLRVIELITDNAVQVKTSICDVESIEEDFDVGVRTVLVDAAIVKDDFTVLVAYYGQEEAAAAIRSVRPGLAAFIRQQEDSEATSQTDSDSTQ